MSRKQNQVYQIVMRTGDHENENNENNENNEVQKDINELRIEHGPNENSQWKISDQPFPEL